MSLALHYWMRDSHHCSRPPSPKWPILCWVDVKLYYTCIGLHISLLWRLLLLQKMADALHRYQIHHYPFLTVNCCEVLSCVTQHIDSAISIYLSVYLPRLSSVSTVSKQFRRVQNSLARVSSEGASTSTSLQHCQNFTGCRFGSVIDIKVATLTFKVRHSTYLLFTSYPTTHQTDLSALHNIVFRRNLQEQFWHNAVLLLQLQKFGTVYRKISEIAVLKLSDANLKLICVTAISA